MSPVSLVTRHRFTRRLLIGLALVGMVVLSPAAAPQAMAQPHDQITYLLPHWFNYLKVSDAEFANEVAQLRSRLGEGPFVKVGFTVFVFIKMNEYDINTGDPAAIQAQLAATIQEIDEVIARARANNIPICLSFLTDIRDNADGVQAGAAAEDRRADMWYSDQGRAPGWITQARYARKLRTVREAYVRGVGKTVANRMALFPETVVAASGDGEVELSFGMSSIIDPTFSDATSLLADYGPFAIAEFRDWLMNAGLYAPGQPFAGEGYLLAGRYQGDATPGTDTNGDGHTLNGDFGTAFTSWALRFFDWSLADDPFADPNAIPATVYNAPGFNPSPDAGAGFFDPPRTHVNGNQWWEVWNLFRQVMIWRHNRDWARWMTSSVDPATGMTIPINRFYSDQIPADYLFGSSPASPNFRLITSGSPHWTASVKPYGSMGVTAFNIVAGATVVSTFQNVAPHITALGERWGLFEYNAAVGGTAPAAFYAAELATLIQSRPSLIIPVFWDTDVPPFFIKDTPFQTMLRDFVTAIKDSPLPAPGTPPNIPTSGQPPVVGNVTIALSGFTGTLNWNAAKELLPSEGRLAATSYIIEVGTASGQTDLATIPVGNVTTFSGSGPALTYFLAVRAVTGFLQGPRSNELMFSLPGSGAGGACTVAPTAPAGLRVSR